MFEKTRINEKEAGVGPFRKNGREQSRVGQKDSISVFIGQSIMCLTLTVCSISCSRTRNVVEVCNCSIKCRLDYQHNIFTVGRMFKARREDVLWRSEGNFGEFYL